MTSGRSPSHVGGANFKRHSSRRNVRLWHKADVRAPRSMSAYSVAADIKFVPKSGLD
jgi:hypothetical protein